MKRCQGLFEKVADFGALREAALRAARGKRDRDEVAEFLLHLESECLTLEKERKEGRYQPGFYDALSQDCGGVGVFASGAASRRRR